MKIPRIISYLFFCALSNTNAQESINELLAAGVADAGRFAA